MRVWPARVRASHTFQSSPLRLKGARLRLHSATPIPPNESFLLEHTERTHARVLKNLIMNVSCAMRLPSLECARAMLFSSRRCHFVTKESLIRIKPGFCSGNGVSFLGTWTDKLRGRLQSDDSGSCSNERDNRVRGY